MRLATIALSSCCGCHIALLNLGSDLLTLLAQGELVFSPVLMDEKSIVPCDIALVEGSIRNTENIEHLKALRANAKTLIAFGTCAAFGGIPGIGSAYATLELLRKSYGEEFTPENIPALEQRVSPIDRFVPVDYYLPGCPPPPDLLKDTLLQFVAGKPPARHDLPVCADCHRTAKKEERCTPHRTINSQPDPDECLLTQGYICLGSVSRSGCGAPCTHAGVPCLGCRGPVDRVLTEPTHGIQRDLTRRMSHFNGKNEQQAKQLLTDRLHTLYAYTLATPELRRKDSEGVSELIHRINV
jgi:F420-non-reducing hydrogenase small subunit